MRYLFILICSSFLFAGCFTISTLDKAKEDRMPERVKEVLTSYKDTSGNAVIIYKKRNRRPVYKAVVPLDTILHRYNAAGKDNLRNNDSTLETLDGVYTIKDAKNNKEMQRVIVMNNETRMTDTTGLHMEMAKNEQLVQVNKGRTAIPTMKYGIKKEGIKVKAVSFTVTGKDNKNYIITFQPQRNMPARYLLVPITVGIDAVTWPVQIVVGLIFLSKVPLS